jgi:pSer/pThr/pTyr-binding forkhead associated (FHA) protein
VLEQGSNVIGRGTEADIRLPDTGVSRKHVDVVLDGGTATVEDLGSTNGTYLDRAKVTGPTRVPLGVPVRIGKTVIELRS